jgi:hypothetical protein
MEHPEYVGIDLHRRRSVIVRRSPEGETLETVHIDNDPVALSLEIAKVEPCRHEEVEDTVGPVSRRRAVGYGRHATGPRRTAWPTSVLTSWWWGPGSRG